MSMLQKGYFILLMLLTVSAVAFGQKTDRDYLRSGNKLYKDSLFVKAEVDYRKALEVNPKSSAAMYNLGNALLMQQKAQKIYADIRDGESSTRSLMNKYGFRHYTQFSRFCKNYLEATPAQLIASFRKK